MTHVFFKKKKKNPDALSSPTKAKWLYNPGYNDLRTTSFIFHFII